MIITDDVLQKFKSRMHLGDDEDENLLEILEASNADLKRLCGEYDISLDVSFRELVFERSRYAYNDALEYFNTNFLNHINNLSVDKALEEIILEVDADATI